MDAVPILIEALKDDESLVAVNAKTALSKIHEYFEEKKRWTERFKLEKGK